MSTKKKTFNNYIADDLVDEIAPEEQQRAISQLKTQLDEAFRTNALPDKFFSLAESFHRFDQKLEHDLALERAALLGHLEASFLFASMKIVSNQDASFLLYHCKSVNADPRCLTLYSQTMENQECGLEFDPQLCLDTINRAVSRAKGLCTTSKDRKWRHALFIALCEHARLVLNHDFNETSTNPSWKVAESTLRPITTNRSFKYFYAIKNLELMDYFILMGRINDKSAQKDNALDYYRKALEIATKMRENIGFLQARIATLTPFVSEATRLLPIAIQWLDDRGVGKNDAEMPDLIARFESLFPAQSVARKANFQPASSLPLPLLPSISPLFLLPPLSANDLHLSLPPSSFFDGSFTNKRPGDHDIFPASKFAQTE